MSFELPACRSVAANPTQAEMQAWALEYMPRVQQTVHGNINYEAKVTARLAGSTFFIAEEENHQNRIPRAEAEEWAARQDAYADDPATATLVDLIRA